MMRRAWCVGVTATSVLLMASTALAQSFCSDLDPLVKLAPSARLPVVVPVTKKLPSVFGVIWTVTS